MFPIVATTLAALALIGPARADFVLSGSPGPSASLASGTASGEGTPAPLADDPRPGPPRHPAAPRFRTAYGFGNDVPLAFAVRQIVPAAVKVSYGPGADESALVNWKGGAPWNKVLAASVQPLGLHLVVTWMAVEIRD